MLPLYRHREMVVVAVRRQKTLLEAASCVEAGVKMPVQRPVVRSMALSLRCCTT